jgi:hypothetical protein
MVVVVLWRASPDPHLTCTLQQHLAQGILRENPPPIPPLERGCQGLALAPTGVHIDGRQLALAELWVPACSGPLVPKLSSPHGSTLPQCIVRQGGFFCISLQPSNTRHLSSVKWECGGLFPSLLLRPASRLPSAFVAQQPACIFPPSHAAGLVGTRSSSSSSSNNSGEGRAKIRQ